MRTVAIIQARMDSSRLPGKVLMPLVGKPLLWHIVHRLRKCRSLNAIAVATSFRSTDDPIEEFAIREKIHIIRGSDENVLARYALAAEKLAADIIVRVCGDSPLIDPVTVDHMVETLIENRADYCIGDPQAPSIHEGFSPLTSRSLWKLVNEAGDDPVAREHVTAYFKRHPGFVSTAEVKTDPNCQFSGARVSVDTPADLRFLEAVYARLNVPAGEADMRDVVRLLRSEPDLLRFNAHVYQKKADDKSRRLLLRCDGDAEIGLGHVYRCIALADELRDGHGFGVSFAMARGSAASDLVRKAGYAIEHKPGNDDEDDWLDAVIDQYRPDALVLDARSELLRSSVAKWHTSGLLIGTIDDRSERRLEADLAFYPAVSQICKMDWTGFTGELYAGWDWVIVRREFCHGVNHETFGKKSASPTILVTMGGSDPAGLTMKAIEALDTIDGDFETVVVLGHVFSHVKAFEDLLSRTRRNFDIRHNVETMSDLMSKSDLAVGSFGVTAYELAAMGVPAIHICLTQNDAEVASTFAEAGIGVSLGVSSQVTSPMLTQAIRDLIGDESRRLKMGIEARQRIDGRGVERIAEIIVQRVAIPAGWSMEGMEGIRLSQ